MVNQSSNTLCEWLYTGNKSFTEPFFDDTISVCRRLPENSKPFKVVTDLQVMEDWSAGMDIAEPAAIIFHISRCGSTLLSQLLALDDTNIVLSEVPFFDALLRLPLKDPSFTTKVSGDLLKAAVKYYSRKKTGNEKHVFIKADSWHLHFYSQLRSVFPGVPFILLYRNPQEVILSQQRQRGMHSVPGIIEPAVFGFSNEQSGQPNLDLYMTAVLEGYFKKMIEISANDPLTLTVDYAEGFGIIINQIQALTGICFSAEMENQLLERTRYHAKKPYELFKEENNIVETPDYLTSVFALYRQLSKLRKR